MGILNAIQEFELDQNHNKIYDNPNKLINVGFPADFLLPLIRVFKSTDGPYFWRGKIVDEMIGISHLTFIYAIAEYLGVPSHIGSEFTGSGFAMRAKIDAIRKILSEREMER